uniref:Cerato-platanin-like protein 2 n=1 Tax=Ganoderma boninense TaxID=34458 RepID=A0A5K1JUD6_9APHY|nr:Cerato-platanin-like protein 2 [Ganoderma boninense]
MTPLLRRHPPPNHYTHRAFRQTVAKASERHKRTPGEYMVRRSPLYACMSRPMDLTTSTNQQWLVTKLKLCPKHSLSLDTTPLNGKPEWGHMEPLDDPRPAWARPQVLFLFVKDSQSPGPSELYRHRDVLAKAQHQFNVQQLTAVFVVVVGHDFVQPMRVDRAGAVLAWPENYVRDPAVLPHLFWRLSVLTDAQLGLDPTAAPVVLRGDPHCELMQSVAKRHDDADIPWEDGAAVPPMSPDEPVKPQSWRHERSWFRTMLDPVDDTEDFKRDRPLWRLSVPNDEDPDVPREFLVGSPLSYRGSKTWPIDERNTRVYVAYDLTGQRFVCLKDSWREVETEGFVLEREGEVLKKLNDAGVPFVPTLVCEADLPGQETRTPEFWSEWDGFPDKEEPTRLTHYRMVTEEICIMLSEVPDSRILVSVIHDCVVAHAAATERCGLLHGDISYNNILICPTVDRTTNTVKWRGMLMDWEFPRLAPTHKDSGTPRPHGRRSWKFTSLAYMHASDRALTVGDELESFFYVLLYTAVRHLPSNVRSPDAPKGFLDVFFSTDPSKDAPCGWGVSPSKQLALRQARILCPGPPKDDLRFFSRRLRAGEKRGPKAEPLDTAFNVLLQEYLAWCHAAYVRSDAGRAPRRNLPRTYRSPAVEGRDLDELARKMEGHEALKTLFEDALEGWPEKQDDPGTVVKSEPGEEEVPAEEFWKTMAQMGGAGLERGPRWLERRMWRRNMGGRESCRRGRGRIV